MRMPLSIGCSRVSRGTRPALMTKTRWLYAEGKREDALRRASEAVAADPESAPAHYLHGTMRLAARQYPEATESFNEVLRLNPRAASAQVQLSRLTLLSGDPQARCSMRRRRPRMLQAIPSLA